MPRKTKKQKIIASYRKKLQLIQEQQHRPSRYQTIAISTPPSTQIKQSTQRTQQTTSREKTENKSVSPNAYDIYLKTRTFTDLKKTLIITLFVLTLEFLVFYANLKGYFFNF